LSYEEQKINISGNFTSTLYPDSYIEYEYTPVPFTSGLPLGDGGGYDELVTKYGNVLTYETPHFSNSQVSFNFTEGVTLDAVAVSYSGAKWTKYVSVNNTQTGNFLTIFNLSDFGTFYTTLGDPFRINLPASKIIPATMNTVKLKIANSSNPVTERDASDSDKIIYTLLILSNYSYSNITNNADGCHWYIEYSDGSTDEFNVPSNYSNGNDCHFDSSHGSTNGCLDEETDTVIQQDAIAQATYLVLRNYLDRNPKDCKIDIKISDYSINTFLLPAVPFLSYTTAEVMSWR
jgi:hypothetical protein